MLQSNIHTVIRQCTSRCKRRYENELHSMNSWSRINGRRDVDSTDLSALGNEDIFNRYNGNNRCTIGTKTITEEGQQHCTDKSSRSNSSSSSSSSKKNKNGSLSTLPYLLLNVRILSTRYVAAKAASVSSLSLRRDVTMEVKMNT